MHAIRTRGLTDAQEHMHVVRIKGLTRPWRSTLPQSKCLIQLEGCHPYGLPWILPTYFSTWLCLMMHVYVLYLCMYMCCMPDDACICTVMYESRDTQDVGHASTHRHACAYLHPYLTTTVQCDTHGRQQTYTDMHMHRCRHPTRQLQAAQRPHTHAPLLPSSSKSNTWLCKAQKPRRPPCEIRTQR